MNARTTMLIDLVKLFPQSCELQNLKYKPINTQSIRSLTSNRLKNEQAEHFINLDQEIIKVEESETEAYQKLIAFYYAEKIVLLADSRRKKITLPENSIAFDTILKANEIVKDFKQEYVCL